MSDRKENAKTPAGAPVMKAASSLVRNDTVPTRSAGTSGRLIACMEVAWRYSSKAAMRAELDQALDVKSSRSGLGRYHSRIIGSMGDDRGPL